MLSLSLPFSPLRNANGLCNTGCRLFCFRQFMQFFLSRRIPPVNPDGRIHCVRDFFAISFARWHARAQRSALLFSQRPIFLCARVRCFCATQPRLAPNHWNYVLGTHSSARPARSLHNYTARRARPAAHTRPGLKHATAKRLKLIGVH